MYRSNVRETRCVCLGLGENKISEPWTSSWGRAFRQIAWERMCHKRILNRDWLVSAPKALIEGTRTSRSMVRGHQTLDLSSCQNQAGERPFEAKGCRKEERGSNIPILEPVRDLQGRSEAKKIEESIFVWQCLVRWGSNERLLDNLTAEH